MTTIDKPDPFDALDTPGEILGFVFHACGVDGVRHVLAAKDWAREYLELAAAELHQAGMRKCAQVVAKAAAAAPSEFDDKCPYPAGSGLAHNWSLRRERRHEEHLARLQRLGSH